MFLVINITSQILVEKCRLHSLVHFLSEVPSAGKVLQVEALRRQTHLVATKRTSSWLGKPSQFYSSPYHNIHTLIGLRQNKPLHKSTSIFLESALCSRHSVLTFDHRNCKLTMRNNILVKVCAMLLFNTYFGLFVSYTFVIGVKFNERGTSCGAGSGSDVKFQRLFFVSLE